MIPQTHQRRVPRVARFALLLLFTLCGRTSWCATPEIGERAFDIPAGPAEVSLKTFSRQSGQGVIFSAERVRGITTNAARGRMPSRTALDLMLAGTPLVATFDEQSGSLSINVAPRPPKAAVEAAEKSAAREAGVAADSGSEPIQLSPFTVMSSADVGYTATNTLAGTRLNTPLRDVGTAVSVVTKEFLVDVAAHDSSTLLPYTVGTEVGGIDGNFAGGSISGGRGEQNGARLQPELNQRVRGLAVAELTRDYFLTDVPFDAYNTDSVTINRGPNALLFGIGSPGGVINSATIAPVFGNDFYEAKLQLGQHKSHRESFDLNREIVPRRLAVRIAGLNDRNEYRQRPAWEKDKRVFGAISAVLAENQRSPILGRTLLRANAEYGDITSNPPNVLPPNDGFSHWWGMPSRELQRFTPRPLPSYYDDGTFVPQFTIDNRTQQSLNAPINIPYFLQFALVYSRPGSPNVGLGDPRFGSLAGGQGRILWTGVPGRIRLDVFATRNAFSSGEFGGDFIGFDNPSIQDRRIFDYYNRLFTGETSRVARDFRTGTVSLEQSFWRGRAGLELSYDHQRHRRASQLPFGGITSDVVIDISRYLGNDQPNPNLGRPFYSVTTRNFSEARTERDTARATAFVTLDGKDLFGAGRGGFWFGRHTLTGMYFDHRASFHSREFALGTESETVNLTALFNQTINQFRRRVGSVVYVGPSLLGARSPADVRLQPIDVVLPNDGDRYTMFHFDPANRGVRNAEIATRRYLDFGNIGRRSIESSVASLQSYLLDSHLVALAGLRRDEQRIFERVNLDNDGDPTTSDRLPAGDFNPAAIRLRSAPSGIASGDTLTWSVVGRYPQKILGRLPLGADLRLFANRSENFNPVGLRRNVFNETLPPPTGTTKEYGGMIEFFGGKLSARLNRFETAGSHFTNTALNGAVDSILNDMERVWLQFMLDAETSGLTPAQAGLAAVGITSFDQAYREIINFHPAPTRSARALRVETANGVKRVVGNPIAGAATTTSFVAEGWELDLAGNPTRGLRLMLNIARQQTVKSNVAPDLRRLAQQVRDNIDKSPLRDVRDAPTLGGDATYSFRHFRNVLVPLDAELAKEGTVSLEQREWRVNCAASYDFRGPLKGWGLGAGARWQSEVSTGYPSSVGPAGNLVPDLSRPFLSGAELNGDAWLSYGRRLFKDRVAWKIQLNLRNAIGSDEPIVVTTNPDGRVAIVRVPPLRQWFLTNTVRF